MRAEIFIGTKVAQTCVDVAVHPGTAFQIPYDERGIAQAVAQLQALQPTLIVRPRRAADGGAGRRWTDGVVINPR